MKVYFDMNIYNRIFDDQSQMRIKFESIAIAILFELIEHGKYELIWSFILEYENNMNPFAERKLHIRNISTICEESVNPDDNILLISKDIIKISKIKNKDALHLASAVFANCNYFITCDDKFIKAIENSKEQLKDVIKDIKLYNPIDFLRKEMGIDVIE